MSRFPASPVTAELVATYAQASKKQKSALLDELVAATGWNRDHARSRITAANLPPARNYPRRKYSLDAVIVLHELWPITDRASGKYLCAAMTEWLDLLEAEGRLVPGRDHYSATVRAELEAMSAATIDRYLAGARARARQAETEAKELGSTRPPRPARPTHPARPTSRSNSTAPASRPVHHQHRTNAEPGFFEVDTVIHNGTKGTGTCPSPISSPGRAEQVARSVNFTDVATGWTFTVAVADNSAETIIAAFNKFLSQAPCEVIGIDADEEFCHPELFDWAAAHGIVFAQPCPAHRNGKASVESKNHHLVRRYAGYAHYTGTHQVELLNQLWRAVNLRANFLIPTAKPGDRPRSPLQRLLAARVLSRGQEEELLATKSGLRPAALHAEITALQKELARLTQR